MPHSSGGGSHGGGSHGGGSHGGSGSSHRTSTSYFPGSVRYAYYHKGRIKYYYRDAEYTEQEKKSHLKERIGIGIFLAVIYLIFLVVCLAAFVHTPRKLGMNYTDTECRITDRAGILEAGDYEEIENVFEEFQDLTGITPALLLIKNSEWQGKYSTLENYAYECYVSTWDDEKHWLIVYSTDSDVNWEDWYWEGMQGDDTDGILTTRRTENFNKDFQDALLRGRGSFTDSFTGAFRSLTDVVMDKSFNFPTLFGVVFVIIHAGITFFSLFYGIKSEEDKARNSVKLEHNVQYMEDTCKYCGGLYIHGIHIECPHCGGQIEPLGQPIYVQNPDSLR